MGGGLSRPSTNGSSYRYGNPLEANDGASDASTVCAWIGTTLELGPKPRAAPLKLDAHFHIHSVLGTGMLGRVRLVQHKKTHKYFALKSMKKADVLAQSMATHVEREREAFCHLKDATFLAKSFGSFQTAHHLHLVLEYAPGGELRRRLHQVGGTFSHDETKFYAAELIVFVDECHRRGFMYRDLKPENVLLDARGHIKVVDLGFVRRFQDRDERCTTSVGTPQYLAPEQLTPSNERRSYTCAVDWWAWGCVVFEMATGNTPFGGDNKESPFEVYTRIVQGKIRWPRTMPPSLKDLLKHMLQPDVSKRLCDGEAIKKHAWFRDVDWQDVEQREVAPPFRPMLKCAGDRACFDEYVDDDREALASGTVMAFAPEFRNF